MIAPLLILAGVVAQAGPALHDPVNSRRFGADAAPQVASAAVDAEELPTPAAEYEAPVYESETVIYGPRRFGPVELALPVQPAVASHAGASPFRLAGYGYASAFGYRSPYAPLYPPYVSYYRYYYRPWYLRPYAASYYRPLTYPGSWYYNPYRYYDMPQRLYGVDYGMAGYLPPLVPPLPGPPVIGPHHDYGGCFYW